MEQQFSTMHLGKPDVIVATPGRFLHLCVEMELQLSSVGEGISQLCISSNSVLSDNIIFMILCKYNYSV